MELPDPRDFVTGPIFVRVHGHAGGLGAGRVPVVVLHGGPGAPGCATGLAAGLAGDFPVLEPWQRWSGGAPLTTAGHVADLCDALDRHAPGVPAALVGESYGAMLALAFAAEHPGRVARVALVGCGTYDRASRARLEATLAERMTPALRHAVEALEREIADPGERMSRQHALLDPLYTFERVPDAIDSAPSRVDARGQVESWADMLRRQDRGIDPRAFEAIDAPVLMLHGDHDPHPGTSTRDVLARHLRDLRYVELARCGHSPWVERHARTPFFEALRAFLEPVGTGAARG